MSYDKAALVKYRLEKADDSLEEVKEPDFMYIC